MRWRARAIANVSLRLDDRDFKRRLAYLSDVQVEKVIEKSLYRTAFDARDAARKYALTKTFKDSRRTRAKKFVTGTGNRAGLVARGMKSTPKHEAQVITAGKTRKILVDHARGARISKASGKSGTTAARLHRLGKLGIPARNVKRNARGQVKFSKYASMQEYSTSSFLVKVPGGDLFAVRTTKSSRAAPRRSRFANRTSRVAFVLFLKKTAKIEKAFPFERLVYSTAERKIERQFKKTWREVITK